MKPIRVCVLHDRDNKHVKEIAPQYSLDKLYELAAAWACGEPIPTSYAHQAIMDSLQKKGYKVAWFALTPEETQ